MSIFSFPIRLRFLRSAFCWSAPWEDDAPPPDGSCRHDVGRLYHAFSDVSTGSSLINRFYPTLSVPAEPVECSGGIRFLESLAQCFSDLSATLLLQREPSLLSSLVLSCFLRLPPCVLTLSHYARAREPPVALLPDWMQRQRSPLFHIFAAISSTVAFISLAIGTRSVLTVV